MCVKINNMKPKISGIYCITNKINGKKYIGCSIDIHRRWWQHSNMNQNKHTSALRNALIKYGIDNFEFEIIMCCCKDYFSMWEKHYISFSGTVAPNGYNLTHGGDAHIIFSDETREKISKAHTGDKNGFYGKKHSEEFKKKQSNSKKGKSSYNKGIPHSEEHKAKLKLAWIARRERMNNDKTTN